MQSCGQEASLLVHLDLQGLLVEGLLLALEVLVISLMAQFKVVDWACPCMESKMDL